MRQQLNHINSMRQAVRETLNQTGLTEVVTPISTLMPGGETHLDAVPIELQPFGRDKQALYLRTDDSRNDDCKIKLFYFVECEI